MMKDLIDAFPPNLAEALAIAKNHTISAPRNEIRNVVICGMGGSGIGGKIVSQWLEEDLRVPVNFCQDYHLPSFVNEYTLVIASSYSGNTEETLISLATAVEKNAMIIAVCSGGQLEVLCQEKGYEYIKVPGGNPPRSALAYSLVQLVYIFGELGLSNKAKMTDLDTASKLLLAKKTEIQAKAMELAKLIGNRTPIFYTVARYEGVAVRAKQQFNENSKKLGWMHTIPEMNHNELVGWGGGSNDFAAIFLDSGDVVDRNRRRIEISLDRVRSKTDAVMTVLAEGNNLIERSIYLIHLVDWASLYHAELHNVDSIEIEIIDYLKDELSKL